MTQRNPLNDRYQVDERQGKTRKSAASVKPKTKAASSVRIQPTEKTKQQKKAEQKASRAKQADLDRKYYNPPTAQYKRLRKIWWGLLIGAVIMTAASWFARSILPEAAGYVTLAIAYGCIIGALYIDFAKIRKVRRAYQEEMESRKTKEQRALEKQQKAAQRAVEQQGSEKETEAAEEGTTTKRGLFGSGFRLSKERESEAVSHEASDSDKGGNDDTTTSANSLFERGRARAQAAVKAVSTSADSTSDQGSTDQKGK